MRGVTVWDMNLGGVKCTVPIPEVDAIESVGTAELVVGDHIQIAITIDIGQDSGGCGSELNTAKRS